MKMKLSAGILLLICTLAILSSCRQNRVKGKGNIETVSRNVPAFQGIKIQAPVNVNIKIVPGATPSISLKGYPNILEEIQTEVEGNTLRIYNDDLVHFSVNEDIIAEITVPTLNALAISGAADVDMLGMLNTTTFDLTVSGAGDVKMEGINAETFNAELSGAGNLEVRGGTVANAKYAVNGAGEIDAFPLQTRQASVSVAGMGDVDVSVSEKLDASVAGAGDINYKGQPQLTTSVAGAGSVQQVQ